MGDLKSMLLRTRRHLVALGEMDRDAGYCDASLVKLMRDWERMGLWGGARLTRLADSIEESAVSDD